MKIIKNPNEIVTDLINDYKRAVGDGLLAVIMYGSAVTHEYKPGQSDINIIVVLKDNSLALLKNLTPIATQWKKRNVAIPFFMTRDFIAQAVDSYPIEFLDIQLNHRILFGEDYFSHLSIERENLRLQCERELRGVAVHLRKEFVSSGGKEAFLNNLARASMQKLLPVFKALLRCFNRSVPKFRGDVVMATEDVCNLKASSLTELLNLNNKTKKNYDQLFENYLNSIDKIIHLVDRPFQEKEPV
jgi:hypothetical protein